MRKDIIFVILFLMGAAFTGCEKVEHISLETAAPRLVIEASIEYNPDENNGNEQTITLTTSTSYYENTVPAVSGAMVFIKNSSGTTYDFTEQPGTGKYHCTDFDPVVGKTYTLTVISNGQTYTATETLYATPEITGTEQKNGGFSDDDVEIRFFFQDDPGEVNFYMTRYDTDVLPYPRYGLNDDDLYQGNEMHGTFMNSDLEAGDVVAVRFYGVSERYYNYMNILTKLSGGGGLLQGAVPVQARGNIVNQTDQDDYALGYFRLGQVRILDYTVQ